MSRCLAQAVRAFAFAALVAVSLAPGGPVLAADETGKPAGKAEVDQLIQTIEQPDSREKLVAQLKLLTKAGHEVEPPEEQGLLDLLTDEIGRVGNQLTDAVDGLAGVGHVLDWGMAQIADPARRALWAEVLGKFALLFAAGLAAERGLMLAFRPLRRLTGKRAAESRWRCLSSTLGLWGLEVLPIVLFVLVVHALRALPGLSLSEAQKGATELINLAYVATRFILVSTGVLLMPSAVVRPLPLDDETAGYLSVWARRLTLTAVWGYFAIQSLKLLGLPKSGCGVAMKGLGLAIAALLVILVLQNRQAVAGWIRRGRPGGRMQALKNRVADIWHVLACLYVVGAFGVWALQVRGGFEFLIRASVLTVVVLAVANAVAVLGIALVGRAFAISEDLRRRLPYLEARANRYVSGLQGLLKAVVALLALVALLQVWGVNAFGWFGSDVGRRLLSSLVSIAIILLLALVTWELVGAGIERYLSRTDTDGNPIQHSARARTLLPLLRTAVLVLLLVMATLMVLSELGVDTAPLLAGAGVVGVAIGFGSQKLVQDVITGAFILFEDTIAVGDVVKIGDNSGTVETLSIRTIRIRAGNGQLHTLPFSSVSTVVNMSRDFGFHTFDISVAYNEDVDRVIAAIRRVGGEMKADEIWADLLPEAIEVFGVDKFDGGQVVIRGRQKTAPGKQWDVGREFNHRLKKLFDQLGVAMPVGSTTLVVDAGALKPAKT